MLLLTDYNTGRCWCSNAISICLARQVLWCLVSLLTGLKVVGTPHILLSASDDLPMLASSLPRLQQLHFAGGFTQLQRAGPHVQVGCVTAHGLMCLLFGSISTVATMQLQQVLVARRFPQLWPAGLVVAGQAA
jgi:hypothetical protein